MDAAIANALLQQAPDALLLADEQGRILFANAAVTELFGYSNEELLQGSVELLLPERFRGNHQRLRQGFGNAPTHRMMGERGVPLFGRRNDGSEFPIWVSLSPIQTPTGLRIAAAIRDVTDWEELTRHLRIASDEAKQASQTKSRFLATASHDLRQPLQVLHLLNAALVRQLQDVEQKNLALRQQLAIDSMTELLNALLDISKLESGTVEVKPEPIDAAQLLRDLCAQLETTLTAKSLPLHTHIDELTLLTDRVLFQQLVQNLLGNALKYTDQGSVTLTLQHDATLARLEIADTGVGIPRDQLARIFDAYYQPHAARPDRPGVGLGLAIVKQITELLGFGIQVDSQPGRGTRFRINIPQSCFTDQRSAPTKIATPAPVESLHHCVLVIEDDQAVREAIALALEIEGCTVFTAADAVQAQREFEQHIDEIDAVVSDYHVDVTHTGVEIVRLLRSLRSKPLPAIFLTGDTSLAVRSQQALERSSLLSKPVDTSQLLLALTQL